MRKNCSWIAAFSLFIPIVSLMPASVLAQTPPASYAVRAPLQQYLIPEEENEIALARSAAPPSISDSAEIMVLQVGGYITAVKGTNGFVCIVERSWATTTDDPQFWNPQIRAPHCLNSAAAKTSLPAYLFKTKLVLAQKSRAELAAALAAAWNKKELPELAPGTMVYMMSKRQFLNDDVMGWHPHVMFYAAGDARKSWGANLPGSPVIAAYDPEQHMTTFFILAGQWSDGTPGPPMMH